MMEAPSPAHKFSAVAAVFDKFVKKNDFFSSYSITN